MLVLELISPDIISAHAQLWSKLKVNRFCLADLKSADWILSSMHFRRFLCYVTNYTLIHMTELIYRNIIIIIIYVMEPGPPPPPYFQCLINKPSYNVYVYLCSSGDVRRDSSKIPCFL